MNIDEFGGLDRLHRIQAFSRDLETPVVVMDLEIVRNRYHRLREVFPTGEIFYAVKANPLPQIVQLLAEEGSSFDIASRQELDLVLASGTPGERISYGNTIKKARDVAYAYEHGVRMYACDSLQDLQNLARHAPGSRIFFRIFTEGTGSDWPLSRKFGAHQDIIKQLAVEADRSGLVPYGISFHVGSQQRDIGEWDDAIARTKMIFDALAAKGMRLQMINIGGGFPARYLEPTHPIDVYASEITRFLVERFGDNQPRLILEPGRYMVGDAGVLVTEVVGISRKARNNLYSWVYLDVGMFRGLIETIGEAIRYPIYFGEQPEAPEGKTGEYLDVILAGPTCDSMDILYENHKYRMPAAVSPGDRVYIYTTGAYTQSYSAVGFNGFPPLQAVVMPAPSGRTD